MTTAEGYLRELPGVTVGPARIAPRCDDVIPRDNGQLGGMLFPARVTGEQARSLRRDARLDPAVSTTAQLARHQYSSGRRMVVTDLSASVMTQMHFSPME